MQAAGSVRRASLQFHRAQRQVPSQCSFTSCSEAQQAWRIAHTPQARRCGTALCSAEPPGTTLTGSRCNDACAFTLELMIWRSAPCAWLWRAATLDSPTSRCTILGVAGESAQDFTDALMTFGAQAAWIQEAVPEGEEEQPLHADPEPGVGPGKLWLKEVWHHCKVVALFAAHDDDIEPGEGRASAIEQAVAAAGVRGALELAWAAVREEDWEAQVKASYKPLQLADGLWIVPDWYGDVVASEQNIILKPGVAFGTGEHATTRLCLQWLQVNRSSCESATVIDYGCGSGVLAIAARNFGAQEVFAIDVDPVAVRVTRDNAELNNWRKQRLVPLLAEASAGGPEPLAAAGVGAGDGPGAAGLVIANILKPALLDLKHRLADYLKPGGKLVLSGLLDTQVDDIKAAYADNISWDTCHLEDHWAVLAGTRKHVS